MLAVPEEEPVLPVEVPPELSEAFGLGLSVGFDPLLVESLVGVDVDVLSAAADFL